MEKIKTIETKYVEGKIEIKHFQFFAGILKYPNKIAYQQQNTYTHKRARGKCHDKMQKNAFQQERGSRTL